MAPSAGVRSRMQFGPIAVEYDEAVLRPRPWTFQQSQWAAELYTETPGRTLELYCGAGQIGLAFAKLCGAPLVQVDDDAVACRWARDNAASVGIDTEIRCRPIDEALAAGEQFGIVLADPPYISSAAVSAFPRDPPHAIDGGPSGLDEIVRCLHLCKTHLLPGGSLLLQMGGARQLLELAALVESEIPMYTLVETRTIAEDRALARLTTPVELPG